MSDLAALQTRVLDALYAPDFTPDAHGDVIAAHPERLDIYRDTLLFGLIDVLSELFEVTRAVMGEDNFKAISRDYVRSAPQMNGDRTDYGAGFAAFTATHEALTDQAWLSELAALEWALHRAHHADDAEALAFDQLLSDIPLTLPPSAAIFDETFDVFGLFQAFHAGALEAFTLNAVAHARLIWRTPTDEVISRALSPLEAQFVRLCLTPASLATHLSTFSPDDFPALQALMAETVPTGLFIEASHP